MCCVLFSGQGDQFIGMGKELYDNFSVVKDIFKEVDDLLNENLSKIIFCGPLDKLSSTLYAQPAIVTICVSIVKILELNNINLNKICSFFAGHSLGQYMALYAAKVLSFQDLIFLVKTRASLMYKAVSNAKGAMLACFLTNLSEIVDVVKDANKVGLINIANYNSSSQVVLSGQVSAISYAKDVLSKKKIRTFLLNVEGAFHTKMMQKASDEFVNFLDKVKFGKFATPVIDNVSARAINDVEKIKEILPNHIISSVLWSQSISHYINYCFDKKCEVQFLNIGPKDTLAKLIKRDKITCKIDSIFDVQSINNFLINYSGK